MFFFLDGEGEGEENVRMLKALRFFCALLAHSGSAFIKENWRTKNMYMYPN